MVAPSSWNLPRFRISSRFNCFNRCDSCVSLGSVSRLHTRLHAHFRTKHERWYVTLCSLLGEGGPLIQAEGENSKPIPKPYDKLLCSRAHFVYSRYVYVTVTLAIESISSKKRMQGAAARALSNSSRTFASDSPNHIDKSSGPVDTHVDTLRWDGRQC